MSNEHAEKLFCQESSLKASKACPGYSSWLTAILHDQGWAMSMLKSFAAKKASKACLGYSSWLTVILYDQGWAMSMLKSFAAKKVA
jgi:hypothetical protein